MGICLRINVTTEEGQSASLASVKVDSMQVESKWRGDNVIMR